MSSVKNSRSDHDTPPQQYVGEKGVVHTLPGQMTKPVPPRPKPRKSQSCRQLPFQSGVDYSTPRPQLPPIFQEQPIPVPRKKPLQATHSTPALQTNSDYTELQPNWTFQPTRTPRPRHKMQHSAPIPLRELAQTPQYLPTTIETVTGYYGFGHKFTISAGDKLYVHFAKHVKMAVLHDRTGTQFHIPLSSAMKFGLLQEEKEFEKVADIVKNSQNLPHIICCQRYIPHHGKQEEVKEGDLLIVKKCQAGLTCHSVGSNQEILLPKKCMGSFSTSSEKTSMYLLDFLQYLSHLLPCKIYLFPPSELKHDLFTRGKVFTLKECTTVTSLVVSNVGAPEDDFFDVILDENLSELRVTVFDKSPPVLRRKDSVQSGHYMRLIKGGVSNEFQEALYTTLRHGLESEGVQLAVGGHGVSDVGSCSSRDYDYIEVLAVPHYSCAGESGRIHISSTEQNRHYLKSLSIHEVGFPLV